MKESFTPSMEQEKQSEISISEVPYRKVAKEAIMSWNGASEEEATAAIESQSYDELENQCWATGSMESGLKGILKSLQEQGIDVSDINSDDLHTDVFGPAEATETATQTGALAALGEKIKQTESPEALVVDTLSEGAGVEVSDDELQLSYYDRVSAFQQEHGTSTTEGLVAAIQQGESFYPALEGQTEITDFMATPEGAATVAAQINEKGIGGDVGYQAYLAVKAEQES